MSTKKAHQTPRELRHAHKHGEEHGEELKGADLSLAFDQQRVDDGAIRRDRFAAASYPAEKPNRTALFVKSCRRWGESLERLFAGTRKYTSLRG